MKSHYLFKHYYGWFFFPLPAWFFFQGARIIFNINNPFVENLFIHIVMMVIFFGLGIWTGGYLFYLLMRGNKEVVLPFRKGQFSLVSGPAKSVFLAEFGGGPDRFEVEGIKFSVVIFSLLPGYNRQAAYGGVVVREGDFLEVKYISFFGDNRILELTIIQRKEVRVKKDGF